MTFKQLFLASLPFFYLLFLLFRTDPSLDIDLGRHLKMGELISTCQCIPEVNTFSYTAHDFYTRNHSWLSEVIFFQIADTFGLPGLVVLKWLIIIVVFSIVYTLAFQKKEISISVIFSLLALALFAPRFTVRPELFSYLFIGVILLLFAWYKQTKKVWLLWIPPLLLVLWVNMHIYFFLGYIMLCVFLVEEVVRNKRFIKKAIPLLLCAGLSLLMNPSFLEGALYPLHIFSNYGAPIIENYPAARLLTFYPILSSQFMTIIVFELLSCFALAGIALYPRRELVGTKCNALIGMMLGQVLMRCVALFSLLGLSLLIQEYIFLKKNVAHSAKKKFHFVMISSLTLLFLILLSLQLRSIFQHQPSGVSLQSTYASAIDFYEQNDLQGNIFHNPALGNYLIYRLFPSENVFLDGRPEAYPSSLFQTYFTALEDSSSFNKLSDRYNINTVIYSPLEYPSESRAFVTKLLSNTQWEPVFWDGQVAIFVRKKIASEMILKESREVRTILQKYFHE